MHHARLGREATRVDDSADFILQANYTGLRRDHDLRARHGLRAGRQSAANGAYYALTWIGIFVTIAVLVGWVVYENRRLVSYAAGPRSAVSRAKQPSAAEGANAEMNGKQIEFPPKQTHVKVVRVRDARDLIICVIIVLIIVLGTEHRGSKFRPTV